MSFSRDQRIADETVQATPPGCRAQGCPLPWSCDVGGLPLCTYHARCKNSHEWPSITQRLCDLETERALRGPRPKPQRYATRADGVAALAKLRHMGRGDPKLWAKRLEWRESKGRALTLFQRCAWREALGLPPPDFGTRSDLLQPEETQE
jgi:hypothetical protein